MKTTFTKVVHSDEVPTAKTVLLKHLTKKSHDLTSIPADLETHYQNNQRSAMAWKI